MKKIRRWLRGILIKPTSTPGWSSPHTRPRYTEEEVKGMIRSGSLTVEGGSGDSREDPIVLRKVPGMLAGREIALILAQKIVEQSASEWQGQKIEYVPNMECKPPCFHYGVLVTLKDGSKKEAWFQIHHLPIMAGEGQ